jgi:aconitate hydratase
LTGLAGSLKPLAELALLIRRTDGRSDTASVLCRIDTADELDYYRQGGILHYVLRNLLKTA